MRQLKPLVIIYTLLLFSGCEGESDGVLPGSSHYALSDFNESEDPPEIASKRFAFTWEDAGQDVVDSSSLAVRIENILNTAVEFDAAMRFAGLMNKSSAMDLGTHKLDTGESIVLSVSASKLPLQTASGAIQAILQVVVDHNTPLGKQKAIELSRARYFRHDSQYKTITHFSEAELIEKYSGILTPPTTVAIEQNGEIKATAVGRMLEESGEFKELKLIDDDSYSVKNGKNIIGYNIGVTTGVMTEAEEKMLEKEVDNEN